MRHFHLQRDFLEAFIPVAPYPQLRQPVGVAVHRRALRQKRAEFRKMDVPVQQTLDFSLENARSSTHILLQHDHLAVKRDEQQVRHAVRVGVPQQRRGVEVRVVQRERPAGQMVAVRALQHVEVADEGGGDNVRGAVAEEVRDHRGRVDGRAHLLRPEEVDIDLALGLLLPAGVILGEDELLGLCRGAALAEVRPGRGAPREEVAVAHDGVAQALRQGARQRRARERRRQRGRGAHLGAQEQGSGRPQRRRTTGRELRGGHMRCAPTAVQIRRARPLFGRPESAAAFGGSSGRVPDLCGSRSS